MQWINAVVFDSIARTHYFHVFQPRYRAQKFHLHINRHARRHALNIHFLRIQSFRFDKQLMALFIRKAHNFRFDRRAVSRSDTLDNTVCHRRTFDIIADNFMRLFIRVRKPARYLFTRFHIAHERKIMHRIIAGLNNHLSKIKTAAVDTRRCSRFKAHDFNAGLFQTIRQFHRRSLTVRSAVIRIFTDDNPAFQIRSRSQYHCFARIYLARFHHNARYGTILKENFIYQKLFNIKIFLKLACFFHHMLIQLLIRLSTQSLYGRSFSRIEHTVLNTCLIGIYAHFTAQSVDFAHKMAFGRSADGRITRHHGNIIHIKRREQRLASHTRTGKRRFHTGMTGAYDNHIIISCNEQKIFLPSVYFYFPIQN